MSLAHVMSHELGPLYIANAEPIVFVIDNDISVRKTLESLINRGGWQSKTFASAHEFLARPRPYVPSVSLSSARTRRSYSSPISPMCTRRSKL
jgi:DNA-binding NtrC family response regulator